MRKIRVVIAVAGLALTGLAPLPAHASLCSFGGQLGTYQIRKLVVLSGADLGSFSYNFGHPDSITTDDQSYHSGMVGYVYDPVRHTYPIWVIAYGGAEAPHAVVHYNGQTLVDSQIPSTEFTGSAGGFRGLVQGVLNSGTYWVVAFGFGSNAGIDTTGRGSGYWTITVNYGYDCPQVNVPAEIRSYNQTNFTGGTEVNVPGVFVGQNLALDFDVSRANVFGEVYGSAKYSTGRWGYSTPTGGPDPRYGMNPMVSTAGHYHFHIDGMTAIDASWDIDFLQVDLPAI